MKIKLNKKLANADIIEIEIPDATPDTNTPIYIKLVVKAAEFKWAKIPLELTSDTKNIISKQISKPDNHPNDPKNPIYLEFTVFDLEIILKIIKQCAQIQVLNLDDAGDSKKNDGRSVVIEEGARNSLLKYLEKLIAFNKKLQATGQVMQPFMKHINQHAGLDLTAPGLTPLKKQPLDLLASFSSADQKNDFIVNILSDDLKQVIENKQFELFADFINKIPLIHTTREDIAKLLIYIYRQCKNSSDRIKFFETIFEWCQSHYHPSEFIYTNIINLDLLRQEAKQHYFYNLNDKQFEHIDEKRAAKLVTCKMNESPMSLIISGDLSGNNDPKLFAWVLTQCSPKQHSGSYVFSISWSYKVGYDPARSNSFQESDVGFTYKGTRSYALSDYLIFNAHTFPKEPSYRLMLKYVFMERGINPLWMNAAECIQVIYKTYALQEPQLFRLLLTNPNIDFNFVEPLALIAKEDKATRVRYSQVEKDPQFKARTLLANARLLLLREKRPSHKELENVNKLVLSAIEQNPELVDLYIVQLVNSGNHWLELSELLQLPALRQNEKLFFTPLIIAKCYQVGHILPLRPHLAEACFDVALKVAKGDKVQFILDCRNAVSQPLELPLHEVKEDPLSSLRESLCVFNTKDKLAAIVNPIFQMLVKWESSKKSVAKVADAKTEPSVEDVPFLNNDFDPRPYLLATLYKLFINNQDPLLIQHIEIALQDWDQWVRQGKQAPVEQEAPIPLDSGGQFGLHHRNPFPSQ